jgi:hypothetical protein
MPITRKYTFDIDTKRYLNRVNTYRQLNGLNVISNSDAVDIDNFIIGLKDLGIFNECLFYLFGSKFNVGAGNIAIGIGGYAKDINLVASPTWTTDYIFCNTSSQYMITPIINIESYNIPNFSCSVFRYDLQEVGGKQIVALTDNTGRVLNNISQLGPPAVGNLFRFSGDLSTGLANRGSLLSPYFYSLSATAFTSIGTSYIPNLAFRLDNSTLTSLTFTSPYDFTQRNIRLSFNATYLGAQGSNKGYYYVGGSVLSQKVTSSVLQSVYTLIKTTIGKGLGLP